MIGQDYALSLVSDAIIRQRSGVKNDARPIGTFLFLGPTGVGKTEVARSLADILFSGTSHIIRLDMSEYMEAFNVSKLIGSAPGYVGYEDGGQLTEAVRRQPYSIILFDEIEKAHPDVYNILLQIFEDGRLTDSHGRLVDFKNTIIIMTSNLASDILLSTKENKNQEVLKVVGKTFKPELINRIDEIVIFNPLSFNDQVKIVDKLINELTLKNQENELYITFDQSVARYVMKYGYDVTYGARPLKRFITKNIETFIAKAILHSTIQPRKHYLMSYDGQLVLQEIK
ncbi:MAG: AAA family ATPase [Acholeplasmatales bacterium]|nr:AAA family ATPase [Acholeplasmatales bacterium]